MELKLEFAGVRLLLQLCDACHLDRAGSNVLTFSRRFRCSLRLYLRAIPAFSTYSAIQAMLQHLNRPTMLPLPWNLVLAVGIDGCAVLQGGVTVSPRHLSSPTSEIRYATQG